MESVAPLELEERPLQRRSVVLLLVAALVHGLAYLLVLPPWMGEDEPWHLEYVHHVADGHLPHLGGGRALTPDELATTPVTQLFVQRRLPTVDAASVAALQRELALAMVDGRFFERVDWADPVPDPQGFDGPWASSAANHPPLYYLAAGGAVALSGLDEPRAQLTLCRLLSLAAYLGVVALALTTARAVFQDRSLVLLAAVVVAWLPIHARQAGVVNNDVLAKLFASAVFCLAVRIVAGVGRPWERWAALGACLLGIATKTTAVASLGVLALALLLAPGGPRAAARGLWPWLGGLVALAAGALLAWRTQRNHAIPWSLDEVRAQLAQALELETWTRLGTSFVGTFNGDGRTLPTGVYAAVGAVALLLAGLALRALVAPATDAPRRRPLFVLSAGALLLQLALIALHGYGVGRYLLPAVVPLAILVAGGLGCFAPGRPRRTAVVVCVGLLLVYDVVYLWAGLLEHQYLDWRA